jgi:PDZ domain-containing secreted protein
MASMLNVYKAYHPESQSYADAAKYFFREVSKGERDYAGVIVFAFKDNASHPFFKVGDIVTSYGGQTVKSYDDFSKAYKTNPDREVTYLRLENNRFAEYKTRIASTDIVGFLDLTE